MGIIRVITSNELAGGNGDEHIYPVTSIKAIYDLDSKSLEDILQEKDSTINNIESKTTVLQADISSVNTQVNEVKSSQELLKNDLNKTKNSITEINTTIQNIQPGGTFLGNMESNNTRSFQAQVNICTGMIDAQVCIPLDIQNIKNGDIIIPKNKGQYQLGDKSITINEVSIIQKQGNNFNVISLGVPFIPIPKEEDKGSTLKIAEDGSLYWG